MSKKSATVTNYTTTTNGNANCHTSATAITNISHTPPTAPTSGQSGTKLKLSWLDANKDEKLVLMVLADDDVKTPLAADEIAKGGRGLTGLKVRNALRRLVRTGWVTNVERGLYKASVKGRNVVLYVKAEPNTKIEAKTKAARPAKTANPVVARSHRIIVETRIPATTTISVDGTIASRLSSELAVGANWIDNKWTDNEKRIAIILLATQERKIGLSKTKVMRATGFDKDFVAPVVRRLKKLGRLIPTNMTATHPEFASTVAVLANEIKAAR